MKTKGVSDKSEISFVYYITFAEDRTQHFYRSRVIVERRKISLIFNR